MSNTEAHSKSVDADDSAVARHLSELTRVYHPTRAAALLEGKDPASVAAALVPLPSSAVQDILRSFSDEFVEAVLACAEPLAARAWGFPRSFPKGSVGRLMHDPEALCSPTLSVAETVEYIRERAKSVFITYVFVVDQAGHLLGVVAMRELLLSRADVAIGDIMIRDPFYLHAEMALMEAMKLVVTRHFPVYPVCDQAGKLVGTIRGQTMFEAQAIEISAQAGSMVGVEREERQSTHWTRSFRWRHPWLQLNLLTAFVAGGVVSFFQDTVDQVVILAAFLPVLAGQSGNTGCQALAVTLRGLTLGEVSDKGFGKLVAKEALLGLLNGLFVGISAAIGMYILARMQENPQAIVLATIVLVAMTASCVVSGIFGALVPLTLKKMGADPATASSIFLTTATDVASMGLLLGLATWVLL